MLGLDLPGYSAQMKIPGVATGPRDDGSAFVELRVN